LRFSPVAFVFNIKHNWFDLAMGHFFSGQLILQLAGKARSRVNPGRVNAKRRFEALKRLDKGMIKTTIYG